uniref:Short coiled-coil protein n=1 Tax=Pipistrellus kuhlii TaxID=59472 RepID=A0A7J7XCW4_PIPKU|nr:short coiled-coil protein [Pipistrellus kuhlii]
MRAFWSGDWRGGAGLPARRRLCGRSGAELPVQSLPASGPVASSRYLPLPAPGSADQSPRILYPRSKSLLPKMMNADMDDLSARVDAVKEENLKLKSENQVLGQYIENLMSASSVFQTTDTKSKRK